jgi:uncharacterized membrane protein YbhN (UPF0104 family)
MKVFKHWVKVLLYVSVGFLIYYLVKLDYLALGDVHFDYLLLVSSVFLLWVGFFYSTVSWRIALEQHGFKISQRLATYSHGISVFAKYIPGKLWVIIGRASLAAKKGGSVKVFSTVSLKEQLVYLFVGLIISLFALIFVEVNFWFLLIILATVISLGLFLFSKKLYQFFLDMFQRIFRKELDVPFVGLKELLQIGGATLLYWAFWSVGFFLLCKSIAPEISFMAAFAFPLSVSYGLLAIFMPGGLGVREGIIVLVLTATGLDVKVATTISVISRIWFISGEIFIFLMALLSKNMQNK